MYTVYHFELPNKKKYVGLTGIEPEKRWKNGLGYYLNEELYFDILAFGWDNIEKFIDLETEDLEEAKQHEEKLINMYDSINNGYNHVRGGIYGMTEEIREKISKSNLGKAGCFLGREHSEYTKKKISQANSGRPRTENQMEAFRLVREKHNMFRGADNPKAKRVRCVETGEVFDTLTEACQKYNTETSHMSKVCKKMVGYKTIHGLHFEYA